MDHYTHQKPMDTSLRHMCGTAIKEMLLYAAHDTINDVLLEHDDVACKALTMTCTEDEQGEHVMFSTSLIWPTFGDVSEAMEKITNITTTMNTSVWRLHQYRPRVSLDADGVDRFDRCVITVRLHFFITLITKPSAVNSH